MARKLYVGNLPYDTAEQDLQTLFASAGTVESVNLIRDMATGRARGFAFVEMVDRRGRPEGDQHAEQSRLRRPQSDRQRSAPEDERRGGYGGGGGNGYGGGGGNGRRSEPRW